MLVLFRCCLLRTRKDWKLNLGILNGILSCSCGLGILRDGRLSWRVRRCLMISGVRCGRYPLLVRMLWIAGIGCVRMFRWRRLKVGLVLVARMLRLHVLVKNLWLVRVVRVDGIMVALLLRRRRLAWLLMLAGLLRMGGRRRMWLMRLFSNCMIFLVFWLRRGLLNVWMRLLNLWCRLLFRVILVLLVLIMLRMSMVGLVRRILICGRLAVGRSRRRSVLILLACILT